MILFWLGLVLMCLPMALVVTLVVIIHRRVMRLYLPRVVRIFQEKPLFIVPRGKPLDDAEVVYIPTGDGLKLRGCYLRSQRPRRGVILFGLEFGSDCWSCRSYCEQLVASGFDVFAFEPRNQGQSGRAADYDPLQWVTEHDVRDTQAALAYLKGRPDADARGVGFFGISKGAGAGVLAASHDPYVLCAVTDGMFGTMTTILPYMRQWFGIYKSYFPEVLIPEFYYRIVSKVALCEVQRERKCRFPRLEKALRRLGSRPLLMIHGGQDKYIKPEMGRTLFGLSKAAPEDREFWLVEGAKHNQALHVAGAEYHERVLGFFERHLATQKPTPLVEGGIVFQQRCCATAS